MGFLRRAAGTIGHVDRGLLRDGLLARGQVTGCERGSFSTGNQVRSVVCRLTVEVHLDGVEPYVAECHHPIQEPYLPQFESGNAAVAVRVDPDDHAHIALDLTHDVPPLPGGAAAGRASGPVADVPPGYVPAQQIPASDVAALADRGVTIGTGTGLPVHVGALQWGDIMATGTPCRAEIVSVTPLGMVKEGVGDVYGIVLSVTADGATPTQAQVGVGVPADAVRLLHPGADLPARRRADVTDAVALDWGAALAEADAGRN